MKINKGSWHYRLMEYGFMFNEYKLENAIPRDLCSYVRRVIRGIFLIAFWLFAGTIFVIIPWMQLLGSWILGMDFTLAAEPGQVMVLLGIAYIELALLLLILGTILSDSKGKQIKKVLFKSNTVKSLAEYEYSTHFKDSFVYNVWRSFRDKTCVFVTYTPKKETK